MALKVRGKAFLGTPVRWDFAKLTDDKCADVWAGGFVVFRVHSVVADHRISHRDDLAAVRRISDHFLITCHGGIEANFSGGGSAGSERNSRKAASVFEGKYSGRGHGAGGYVPLARDGTKISGKSSEFGFEVVLAMKGVANACSILEIARCIAPLQSYIRQRLIRR